MSTCVSRSCERPWISPVGSNTMGIPLSIKIKIKEEGDEPLKVIRNSKLVCRFTELSPKKGWRRKTPKAWYQLDEKWLDEDDDEKLNHQHATLNKILFFLSILLSLCFVLYFGLVKQNFVVVKKMQLWIVNYTKAHSTRHLTERIITANMNANQPNRGILYFSPPIQLRSKF